MNPTFTKEQVAIFHKALYEACGLPTLRPSMSDERSWWEFLLEMAPLSEEESGPFSIHDIEPVIKRMKWECREGKASWSLRPSHILRNPETFRDLVLICRTERRKRRSTQAPISASTMPQKPSESPEPILSREELAEGFAQMRKKLQGGAA